MKSIHHLFFISIAAYLCVSFTFGISPYISNDESKFLIASDTSYLRFEIPLKSGEDDVEENGLNGAVYSNSTDLELCYDRASTGNQTIGLRFTGIWLPPGAVITKSYIQFTADESQNVPGTMTIFGEDVADSPPFQKLPYDVSTRARTANSVEWIPDNWTADESGTVQQTTDVSTIIQEISERPDWTGYGLAITFIIEGEGKRIAKSYELDPAAAPMLYIEYGF